MPKEASRGLRKGTRSCVACRQSKIRCIYSTGARPCDNCAARSRACVAQGPTSPAPEAAPSSRERIHHLENQVGSLWRIVRQLEAKVSLDGRAEPHEPDHTADRMGRQDHEASGGHVRSSLGSAVAPASITGAVAAPKTSLNGNDDISNSSESEPDELGLSAADQPAHLRQLFDNDLLRAREPADAPEWGPRNYAGSHSTFRAPLTEARRQLQELLPSRNDVAAITGYSLPWMTIYNALFPRIRMMGTGGEMLSQYDELCTPNANPMSLANLLISLALTVRQIPASDMSSLDPGIHNAARFIDQVSDVVDRTIASNDTLAATLDGIETSLLFVRLALACVDVRKMWIRLRRIIALAELVGLPRASKSVTPTSTIQHKSAAAIWESICNVDRLAGMMFNLPCGTRTYSTHHANVISEDGKIDVQAFLGRLTEIALSVQDLDNAPASERPDFQQLSKVYAVDEALKKLADCTPADWWIPSSEKWTPECLLQYWHYYFAVRTHLRLALADDDYGRYRLSYNICVSACQNMARRYMDLRPILPSGFFACRIIDFQILTAGVFLLFDSSKISTASANMLPQTDSSSLLIDQLISSLDTASRRIGGDFAEKAVVALRSLRSLMLEPPDADGRAEMNLNLPMLGKISVTRKMPVPPQEQLQATQTNTGWQLDNSEIADGTMYDNAAAPFWAMDVMDDFTFLPDLMSGDNLGLVDYGFPLGDSMVE